MKLKNIKKELEKLDEKQLKTVSIFMYKQERYIGCIVNIDKQDFIENAGYWEFSFIYKNFVINCDNNFEIVFSSEETETDNELSTE